MAAFNKAFGTCVHKPNATGQIVEVCAVTVLQQSLISLTLLFATIGGATSALTGRYLGRRGTMQVGSFLIAVGAGGMLGTAGNFTAYMACKCIGGVGIGKIMAGATAYGTFSFRN
jgi:MFS transporter, SP family, sugar:H+ symporter